MRLRGLGDFDRRLGGNGCKKCHFGRGRIFGVSLLPSRFPIRRIVGQRRPLGWLVLFCYPLGNGARSGFEFVLLRKNPFIRPMAPTLAKLRPSATIGLTRSSSTAGGLMSTSRTAKQFVFSRNGADLIRRFRAMKPVIDTIPAKSAIVDCELVACDEAGLPCFRTLMDYAKNNAPLCLWAFDLLYLNGVRITPLSLTDRKEALAEIIMAACSEHLQLSGTFTDPIKLLETCAKMGLEGIVSKRKDSAYRSGPTKDWLKVKTAAWRATNTDRFGLIHKRR
jgi:hypothetical protein